MARNTRCTQGYYKAAGLDVTLIPAGQGVDQVQMVAAGIATIGIDNPEPILAGRKPGREVQGSSPASSRRSPSP